MMQTKYIIFICIVAFLSLIPLVYADEQENVNIMDFPKQLSEKLGLPTGGDYFAGKILASVIFMCLPLFPTMIIAKKDPVIPGLLVGLGMLGFCTALGWMPIWFMLIICMLVALLFSGQIRNWITGRVGG